MRIVTLTVLSLVLRINSVIINSNSYINPGESRPRYAATRREKIHATNLIYFKYIISLFPCYHVRASQPQQAASQSVGWIGIL